MKKKVDTIAAFDESGAAVSILVFENSVGAATRSTDLDVGSDPSRVFKLEHGGLVRAVNKSAWRSVDTGALLQRIE